MLVHINPYLIKSSRNKYMFLGRMVWSGNVLFDIIEYTMPEMG